MGISTEMSLQFVTQLTVITCTHTFLSIKGSRKESREKTQIAPIFPLTLQVLLEELSQHKTVSQTFSSLLIWSIIRHNKEKCTFSSRENISTKLEQIVTII